MRMNEQIARDAEVARIHAEEEIQGMIDSLDKSNETIAKYLQEYQQFALDLQLEKKIELISDLLKYQEHYTKIENFIPMGSKEETERLKRRGLNLEKEQVKKQKSSEEPLEIEITTKESTEDKIKEIMQLSSTLPTIADEPASPVRDDSQGEACPTDSDFIADQDRATIAKSSTLPYDSAPREEIGRLKERVQVLEDREAVASKPSREDAPIKGRSNNEGEAAAERISNDSEEIARVLTYMDASTILAVETNVPTGSGFIPTAGTNVPTGRGFIPTAGPPATVISTGSEGRIVGNKMHKAFPLPGESSHWQYKFPLPMNVVPTARRLEIPLLRVCTAIEEMMKKLPVKDRWQLH
nr:hypothetical protein [Tanacetum cinerariifolium]